LKVRHGDPDLEWPQRPETGRYSVEAERKRRNNERWAALEASYDEASSEEEYFDEYDKEWLKDLTILVRPPPSQKKESFSLRRRRRASSR